MTAVVMPVVVLMAVTLMMVVASMVMIAVRSVVVAVSVILVLLAVVMTAMAVVVLVVVVSVSVIIIMGSVTMRCIPVRMSIIDLDDMVVRGEPRLELLQASVAALLVVVEQTAADLLLSRYLGRESVVIVVNLRHIQREKVTRGRDNKHVVGSTSCTWPCEWPCPPWGSSW